MTMGTGAISASPESRRPLLHEGTDALAHIVALRDEGLRERFLGEAGGEIGVEGTVEEPLREPEGEGRTAGETLGPLARRRLELGRRYDLVHEAEPLGVGGREVVAEEDELLRLVEPHVPRQEEGPPRIDRDAAADEDLDEAGVVGREHQVAGVRKVRAQPGGHAVHRRERRLLELPERPDDPLAGEHGGARVARTGGSRGGSRRPACRPGAREIRAGAEALPGPGQHDGADLRILRAARERIQVRLPHLGVHRVPRLGTVEDDPANTVLDPEKERVRHRTSLTRPSGACRDYPARPARQPAAATRVVDTGSAGTRTTMRVPSPGRDRTASRPPKWATRSRMLSRPRPAEGGGVRK